MAVMRSVGLKVLKNKLSEYVRLAASGETVLITDRDRVVAELVPPAVTRELHILSVGSKKLDRSQMQSVERSQRSRPGVQSPRENHCRHIKPFGGPSSSRTD